ncbi:MAG: hypothetical protein GY772_01855 [bacterium]|nr:hypothetical protein [bacterium]
MRGESLGRRSSCRDYVASVANDGSDDPEGDAETVAAALDLGRRTFAGRGAPVRVGVARCERAVPLRHP